MKLKIGNPLKAIRALLEAILRMIASFLKALFGIVMPAGGTGGVMVPQAPAIEKNAAKHGTAELGHGFDYSPEQKATITAAILAFAGAPRDLRKDIDLTLVPALQKAFLNACDEKTLVALSKMEPDKALDFVLIASAKAKTAMTKHLPRDERLRIAREAPAVADEIMMEEREKRQSNRPQQQRAAPGYRFAMG